MSAVVYSIDTSSIITAWNETYRPVSFPSFWKRLDELIAEGRALACEEVKHEVSRKDDAASEWVNERPNFFVDLDEEQLLTVKMLAKEHPELAKERFWKVAG